MYSPFAGAANAWYAVVMEWDPEFSKYPVVYFRDGHNFYGPVDPTFRTGAFR